MIQRAFEFDSYGSCHADNCRRRGTSIPDLTLPAPRFAHPPVPLGKITPLAPRAHLRVGLDVDRSTQVFRSRGEPSGSFGSGFHAPAQNGINSLRRVGPVNRHSSLAQHLGQKGDSMDAGREEGGFMPETRHHLALQSGKNMTPTRSMCPMRSGLRIPWKRQRSMV